MINKLFSLIVCKSTGCYHGTACYTFKLGMCAQENWRRLRGFNDLAQVINGVKFKDGIEVKAVDQAAT